MEKLTRFQATTGKTLLRACETCLVGDSACANCAPIDRALARLADYEHTGYLPEEITPRVEAKPIVSLCSSCTKGFTPCSAQEVTFGPHNKVIACDSYVGETKIDLCDSCANMMPTCAGLGMIFGDGVGLDNVIKCETYERSHL